MSEYQKSFIRLVHVSATMTLLLAGVVHSFSGPRAWWEALSTTYPEAHVIIGGVALLSGASLALTSFINTRALSL